jgi:pimeloyl-ACP methyl ester carboxylesterase
VCAPVYKLHAQTSAEPNKSFLTKRFSGNYVDRLIPISGGQLCCVERLGSGPALVLIPGTFSDSRIYGLMAPHLAPDLHLLIIENRGLGKSWPPPENGSIEQCAQDTLKIVSYLGVENFYIGGHSLGGMISKEVGRVAFDQVKGIISIEGWTSWHAARDAFDYDMKSTLSEEQLSQAAAYRRDTLHKWSKDQESRFGRIWRKWDGYEFLQKTDIPVLELYGDRGKPQASRNQLRIPERGNIELRWFSNASHKLLVERPQEVAASINTFIQTQEARRK